MLNLYLEDDGFRRGLIFRAVLASLAYTQTCTYNKDTITTLQNIISTLQIFHQCFKYTIQANVFNMALKLNKLHVQK